MTEAILVLCTVLSLATLVAAIAAWRRAGDSSSALRPQLEEVGERLGLLSELQERGERSARAEAKGLREEVAAQVGALAKSNEDRLQRLRGVVDQRLREIQQDSAAKLEQMRATVDEKLQSTLERRLGESFKQVSERLEQVHKGLGEVQALSA